MKVNVFKHQQWCLSDPTYKHHPSPRTRQRLYFRLRILSFYNFLPFIFQCNRDRNGDWQKCEVVTFTVSTQLSGCTPRLISNPSCLIQEKGRDYSSPLESLTSLCDDFQVFLFNTSENSTSHVQRKESYRNKLNAYTDYNGLSLFPLFFWNLFLIF